MRTRLVLCAAVALMALPATAHGAAAWHGGVPQESQIIDCQSIIINSPMYEYGTAATAYVYEDYNAPPTVGQAYELGLTVFALGNDCAGQAADIVMALPANTVPDITPSNPVKCLPMVTQNNMIVTLAADTSGGCPQSPTQLPNGTWRFDMAQKTGFFATTFFPFWGLAPGAGVEMLIPVVSSAALPNGASTGVVQMADGYDNPTLRPNVLVLVGPAATQTPGTSFAIQNPTVTNLTNMSATLSATFVLDHNSTPDAVFAYGTTVMSELATSQSLDYAAGMVPYQDDRSLTLTGLQPGCTYHWNAGLEHLSTTLATSGDLTFTTTGSGGNCSLPIGGASQGAPTNVQQVQPFVPPTVVPSTTVPPLNLQPVHPPATTTTQTTPVPPPPPNPDHVTHLSVAASTIKAGSPLTVQVTLAAAARVTVTIVRHVPASGHGKHRRKAHDQTIGTRTFTGRVGVNKLKLATIDGKKLVAGRYTAKIVSGGKAHSVNFTVKAATHK